VSDQNARRIISLASFKGDLHDQFVRAIGSTASIALTFPPELHSALESSAAKGIADGLRQTHEHIVAPYEQAGVLVLPTRWAEEFSKHLRVILELDPALLQAAEELGKLGWTIPMWASPTILPRLVTSGDAGAIEKAFVRAYSRNGAEQFTQLSAECKASEFLKPWRPLFQQCVRAYVSRQYRIVVPSLLLTIEGMTVTIAGKQHTVARVRDIARERAARADGIAAAAWLSMAGFLDEVFGRHDFAKLPLPRLNRHCALHGRSAPNWGRADCLRLFQAIDTLCALAD